MDEWRTGKVLAHHPLLRPASQLQFLIFRCWPSFFSASQTLRDLWMIQTKFKWEHAFPINQNSLETKSNKQNNLGKKSVAVVQQKCHKKSSTRKCNMQKLELFIHVSKTTNTCAGFVSCQLNCLMLVLCKYKKGIIWCMEIFSCCVNFLMNF